MSKVLPQLLFRGQSCATHRGRFRSGPGDSNLLRTHLLQTHRMQNGLNAGKNTTEPVYIDLTPKTETQRAETSQVDVATEPQNGATDGKETTEKVDSSTEVWSTSAQPTMLPDPERVKTSAFVVDELKRVLESRKKSEPRDEQTLVASSSSDQVRRSCHAEMTLKTCKSSILGWGRSTAPGSFKKTSVDAQKEIFLVWNIDEFWKLSCYKCGTYEQRKTFTMWQ